MSKDKQLALHLLGLRERQEILNAVKKICAPAAHKFSSPRLS